MYLVRGTGGFYENRQVVYLQEADIEVANTQRREEEVGQGGNWGNWGKVRVDFKPVGGVLRYESLIFSVHAIK
jgi:hypothetical protein